ncbi:uncharacterized protein [Dysidea avara]|uniref:uncharacterized protein n=1 Tax=Dysidea avara TaxID=196820 RepID=UPI00332FBC70
MLQRKGIDAIALGNAAGIPKKTANYRRLFKERTDLPKIVFCTPEYLFGTPSSCTYSGTSGMFHIFVDNSEMFCMVTIDEAHKVFDRMPDYRSTFDSMKQLKELSCPIVAMSATLTDKQISELKQEFLRSDKCVVLINSVSRSNLQILLQRYRRRRHRPFADISNSINCDDEDCDEDDEYQSTLSSSQSMWGETVSKVLPLMKDQSTVLYLDFVKDVEDVTDVIKRGDVNVGKYTGQMKVPVIRIGCPRNLGVLLQELGRAGRKPNSTALGLLLFNEVQDDKRLGVWLKSALEKSNEGNAHYKQKNQRS